MSLLEDRRETERCREAAAWTLYTVCRSHSREVIESGAVPGLLRALANGSPTTREAAAWAAWELAESSRAAAGALLDGGALEALRGLEQDCGAAGTSLQEAVAGARAALGSWRLGVRSIGEVLQSIAAASSPTASPGRKRVRGKV